MSERCCYNCKHFESVEDEENDHCRRFPPVFIGVRVHGEGIYEFPIVIPGDHCGEWSAKEIKDTPKKINPHAVADPKYMEMVIGYHNDRIELIKSEAEGEYREQFLEIIDRFDNELGKLATKIAWRK